MRNLKNVNKRFRAIIRMHMNKLPAIYLSNGADSGFVSVRNLMSQYGPSRGVVIEIKHVVAHPKWSNAWLNLIYTGRGWFIMAAIYWKRR